MIEETQGSETDLTGSAKETPPTTPSTIVASLDKSILQVLNGEILLLSISLPLLLM